MSARPASAPRRSGKAPDALVFAVIIGCVWFGWQIVRNAVVQAAPPDLALRLGPDSPTVLVRAAQAELEAGRNEAARRLAGQALARKPFNAQALRIVGLIAAREGDEEAADRMLTLAGNWSLRDDPAHTWLVGRRLRRGQTASALAHADTLVRRRTDLRPEYFDLMISAALSGDRQAQGALVGLLKRDPPWRGEYFRYSVRKREGLLLAAGLAIALKSGEGKLTLEERSLVYSNLVSADLIDPLRTVRRELEGAGQPFVTAGNFSDGGGSAPFGWRLPSGAGLLSEIAIEGGGAQPALHAAVSDLKGGTVAEQLVLLPPGRWRLSGRLKVVEGALSDRLAWTLNCTRSSGRAAATAPLAAASHQTWTQFSNVVDIPASGCPAQWLRLVALPQDRRTSADVWIDDVALTSAR